jgi:probable rRNA maturation factor
MPAARHAPLIEIMQKSDLWNSEPEAEAVLRRAIGEAQREASSGDAEIAIVLTDDSEIRTLNRTWRKQDKPTNVLSFPTPSGAAGAHLGDIVIAYETVTREAKEQGKSVPHHLAHLAVHGYLHLVGYDHGNDREAETMERLEAAILSRLGIRDPYAENHV